jgi:hypothetical protein
VINGNGDVASKPDRYLEARERHKKPVGRAGKRCVAVLRSEFAGRGEVMPPIDDIVLIVAYHYPPNPGIGGVRPHRFAKYLKRMGYRIHVIAASHEGTPERQVTYVPDPFWVMPRRGVATQVELFCRRFFLQGANGLQWAWRVAETGRAFICENAGHRMTLFSTYPPVGTHLAAYLITGTERVPWIADFRDPLGDLRAWRNATRPHKASWCCSKE